MKFPRNARILRSQLDAAPLAAVLFLLVLFVLMASLLYTPGVHIELPLAEFRAPVVDLPGTDQRTINVALDVGGRLFLANRLVTEGELKSYLRLAATNSPQPPTLVVHADKAVTLDSYVRLTLLAREAGIHNSLLATLPRLVSPSGKP